MEVNDLLSKLELNPPTDLSPVRSRQRDKAIALIREEMLLDAALSFNTVQLQGIEDDGRLRVGGELLPAMAQLSVAGELFALGCGACTLGPRLEVRIRQLYTERRSAQALALDNLSNELLIVLRQRLKDDIQASVSHQGLSLRQELRIDDLGHDLPAQAAVLRLAGAGEIGITLKSLNLLLPMKSITMVFAIGHKRPEVPTLKTLSLLFQVWLHQLGGPLTHSI